MSMSKYDLGRALAAEQDAKLDNYGTDTAAACAEREAAIVRDIEAAGGWDTETDRGYSEARRAYAAER